MIIRIKITAFLNVFLEKGFYENTSKRLFLKWISVYYISVNYCKTSESKEFNICHWWYFLDKDFTFQSNVSSGCHDLLIMSMNLSDIAILNNKSADYCYIISGICKSEDINLMQNTDLTEKGRTL